VISKNNLIIPIMKIGLIFLTLFCSICFPLSAQVDDFQENIIEYLNSNGTEHQYGDSYDELFDVLKEQFLDVPDEEWSELKIGKNESVQDIIKFLAFAYRKHFTESDINTMTNFYKTETAKKLVAGTNDLTKEENDKILEFFQSDVGKKMESKRVALSVDTAEISSTWSRELFAEKMSALVKKGYSTKY
jgi:hypothetical protein